GPVWPKVGQLPALEIQRFHRPREAAIWSSFGPGVFTNFDTKVQLIPSGLGNQPNVILFDATSNVTPLTFFEKSPEDIDTAVDGLYHETTTRAWKSLELYDAKTPPTRTGDQSVAATVVLAGYSGERWLFEIIRTQPADVLGVYGRLIRQEDPNGNAIEVSYK